MLKKAIDRNDFSFPCRQKVLLKFTERKKIMKIVEALKWRYATKKFDSSRILPSEKIDNLKKAFNLTATSYGLQPIKLVVLSDKEMQSRLVEYSFNQQQIGTASHLLIICREKNIDRDFIENYFKRVQEMRTTPENVLKPFKESLVKEFGEKEEEEIAVWATHQAYLALGTLMTVCAAEAVDSCPMEGFQPGKYDELLGLEEQNLSSVLVLPVGYRAEDDMFADFRKVRRPMEDMIIDY